MSLGEAAERMLEEMALRILARVLYWLVVLAVSVVLLVLLVSFFESRDESQIDAAVTAIPLLGVLWPAATVVRR
jgi:uncharacterized membrane protein YhaH (DUF805 family)